MKLCLISLLAKKKTKDSVSTLSLTLSEAFKKIREEFEEHRESINENTNEIQGNYELICKMDLKLDKLSERLDQLELLLNDRMGSCTLTRKKEYQLLPLTLREQEIFVVLYAANDALDYKTIARKTALTETLVASCVTSILSKGIPLVKRYNGSSVCVTLESDFKQCQAKENIVRINEVVSSSIHL